MKCVIGNYWKCACEKLPKPELKYTYWTHQSQKAHEKCKNGDYAKDGGFWSIYSTKKEAQLATAESPFYNTWKPVKISTNTYLIPGKLLDQWPEDVQFQIEEW